MRALILLRDAIEDQLRTTLMYARIVDLKEFVEQKLSVEISGIASELEERESAGTLTPSQLTHNTGSYGVRLHFKLEWSTSGDGENKAWLIGGYARPGVMPEKKS